MNENSNRWVINGYVWTFDKSWSTTAKRQFYKYVTSGMSADEAYGLIVQYYDEEKLRGRPKAVPVQGEQYDPNRQPETTVPAQQPNVLQQAANALPGGYIRAGTEVIRR